MREECDYGVITNGIWREGEVVLCVMSRVSQVSVAVPRIIRVLFCLVFVSRLGQPLTAEQAISDEVCDIRRRCYSIELTVHVSRRTTKAKRGRNNTVVALSLLLSQPHQVVRREQNGPMALGKPQIEEVTAYSSPR